MSELPDKLSELIRVALADLAKVEAMPDVYRVSMGAWHSPQSNGTCAVCFAGAVMAKTLGIPANQYRVNESYDGFSSHQVACFDALDAVRCGDVQSALQLLGQAGSAASTFTYRDLASYDQSAAAFRSGMVELASDLEEAGL